eukprot:TRINITY_DN10148_c0_g1_i1.p1 TRINITY_DN10148_c0_g1~~TRINITY_DN10148_c0_g1_i1.p1  ORF type:complete len:527 (+),score=107.17 TRINITY_DN10148_c0_g1_i1:88-1668(+)
MEETKEIPANIGQMGIGIQKLIHVQTETIKQGLVGIGNIVKKEGTSSKDAILELQDSISELSDVITTNHEDLMKVFAKERERKLRKTLGIYYLLLSRSPQTPEAHGKILFDAIADKFVTKSLFVELLDHLCEGSLEWRNPRQNNMFARTYCIALGKNHFGTILKLQANEENQNEVLDKWSDRLMAASGDPKMGGELLRSIIKDSDETLDSMRTLVTAIDDLAIEHCGIPHYSEWIPKALALPSDEKESQKLLIQQMLQDFVVPSETIRIVLKVFGFDESYIIDSEILRNIHDEIKAQLCQFGREFLHIENVKEEVEFYMNLLKFCQSLKAQGLSEDIIDKMAAMFREWVSRFNPLPNDQQIVKYNGIQFNGTICPNVVVIAEGKCLRGMTNGTGGSCLDVGISFGKFSWTFYHRSGSNICIGLTERPIETWIHNSKTKSKAHLLNIENSKIYVKGEDTKIKVSLPNYTGTFFRFDLDMNLGTCRLFVNKEDRGVIFNGLTGTQYPCVHFKGSSDQMVTLSQFHWRL